MTAALFVVVAGTVAIALVIALVVLAAWLWRD
jgi:hypothetical protein